MGENNKFLKRLFGVSQKHEILGDLLRLTMHPNGHRREYAVRRLGVLGDSAALSHLLVRVNDWVPQVREAARDAISMLMIPGNARAFTENLPALSHLQTCLRDDHAPFVATVINYLITENNAGYLREATSSEDPQLARNAVRLCFDYSLMDKFKLVKQCLSNPDILVRVAALDHLEKFSGRSLDCLLEQAIKDPFMPIRREAFQIYLRVHPEYSGSLATEFLFDKHNSIREIAIKYLLAAGCDVEEIYSSEIQDASPSISRTRFSILGFGILNAKEKLPTILRFLDNKSPSIRKSVIQTLERLIGEEAKLKLVTALGDSSNSVAKESARLIRKQALTFSANEISETVNLQQYSHTLRIVARVMEKSNKWERLLFLLSIHELPCEDSHSHKELLGQMLQRWNAEFNRSASQPSTDQLEKIRQQYLRVSQFVDDQQKRSIEFTLSTVNSL